MENKQPLLSMCIPTYNGGDKLEICLDKLFTSIAGNMDVEVIVSDNCSTDNTQEIIKKYKTNSCFRYYRNDTNVGFNGNLLLLIDNYAKGDYCWVIGDDDYIDQEAIGNIIKIIESKHPSYISLRHRCLTIDEFKNHKIDSRNLSYEEGSYFHCIDTIASTSNVLGTFMSSHVFKLAPVRTFDKSVFRPNDWNTFMYVFPNSYMMMKCFYKNNDCVCIKNPIITALIHPKGWDNKLNIIKTKVLPDGLRSYKKLSEAKENLSNCRDIIYKDIIFIFIKELKCLRISKHALNELLTIDAFKTICHIIYNKIWKRY